MAIYYVERDYRVSIVSLFVKCPECGLNMEVSVYSNQDKIVFPCKCCERLIEVKIVVCPECNSSVDVISFGLNKHPYCKVCEKCIS